MTEALRPALDALITAWLKEADDLDDQSGVTVCAHDARRNREHASALAAVLQGSASPQTGELAKAILRAATDNCAGCQFDWPLVGSDHDDHGEMEPCAVGFSFRPIVQMARSVLSPRTSDAPALDADDAAGILKGLADVKAGRVRSLADIDADAPAQQTNTKGE